MKAAELLAQLRQLPDRPAREAALCQWLPRRPPAAVDELLELLRREGVQQHVVDSAAALAWARLIRYTAGWNGQPQHLALGLRAEAQIYTMAHEDYPRALSLFDAATKLLPPIKYPVERARIEVTRVWALACVGQLENALAKGAAAAKVLRDYEIWSSLGTLYMNLAVALNRAGDQTEALAFVEQAADVYGRLGEDGRQIRLAAAFNRGLILSDLGRYQEAITILEDIFTEAKAAGLEVIVGLAYENLARIYERLGHYGQALKFYDDAGVIFRAQKRRRDIVMVELGVVQCLLALRRYAEASEMCRRLRPKLTELGLPHELAQFLRSEAHANQGMGAPETALEAYQEARRIFSEDGADFWAGYTELEMARLLYGQQRYQESINLAQTAAERLHAVGVPATAALAELIISQNAWQLGERAQAEAMLQRVRQRAMAEGVAELDLAAHRLLGLLAVEAADLEAAAVHYERAIANLERLQRQVMIEHRADYLDDKYDVFELMVAVQLELGQPEQAFNYVERAKSQALLDMVALRLDVGVRARVEQDQPLVDELNDLQNRRDRLARHWQQRLGQGERVAPAELAAGKKALADLERGITRAWHRLLIRNEQYAHDAALWQTQSEPVTPYLSEDSVLIDYFVVDGDLVAFLITHEGVEAVSLAVSMKMVEKWLQRLHFYMRTTARAQPSQLPALIRNTQGLLAQCYAGLLAPLADRIMGRHLFIVPHGPLHYLPFHALFDGQQYLLQTNSLSYLPGATFLRYCRQAEKAPAGAIVVGHSFGGALAYTQTEARAVAAVWQTEPLLEEAATVATLRRQAQGQRLLHLATHGDFRADNPLFSGLALADGWLTTLSVFDLRLQASLVTLSACQTGMSVVGGGNELLGLMRAFLSAGAASLVSSLWTVDDQSTAFLMADFYEGLAAGQTKAAALRQAQLNLLHGNHGPAQQYGHPFFWAPFYLVGDDGHL